MKPDHLLQFLNAGRLVHVVDGDDDWGWGCVVNFQKKAANNKKVCVCAWMCMCPQACGYACVEGLHGLRFSPLP